jgi:hypothetical protein
MKHVAKERHPNNCDAFVYVFDIAGAAARGEHAHKRLILRCERASERVGVQKWARQLRQCPVR